MLLAALGTLLWAEGCSRGGAEATTHIGAVSVVAALSPDPPHLEGNTLELQLSANDTPVEGTVSVTAVMPAMGAMAEMRNAATIEPQGEGHYRASFDLHMSGMWTLLVDVKSAAGNGSAEFRLSVGSKGLSAVGSTSATTTAVSSTHDEHDHGDVDFYTCPMHPAVHSPVPGNCPFCGMTLTPVLRSAKQDTSIVVDAIRRQQIGVRTSPVQRRPLQVNINTVGHVTYDESRMHDVNPEGQPARRRLGRASVAVWVGLIALAGLDAETGVVMLLYLTLAHDRFKKAGRMNSRQDLAEAIVEGSAKRIRTKLMTVMTMMIGLLPILWSDGTGADVMKRIAAPMIGGLVTSFLLELTIYPAIFALWKGFSLPPLPPLPPLAPLDEATLDDPLAETTPTGEALS